MIFGFVFADASAIYADNPVVPSGTFGPFGHGTHPTPGVGDENHTHVGIDMVAACGNDIYAFADGKVIDVVDSENDRDFARRDENNQIIPNTRLGYMVMIEHPSTVLGKISYSFYIHLEGPPLVGKGREVVGGRTKIGKVGKTGAANEILKRIGSNRK